MNKALLGKQYPAPDTFEVGREHIRQFAEAIGDTNPVHRDPAAARAAGHPDIIAPPTFLHGLGFRFPEPSPLTDPELGVDFSRIVHGEQAFDAHRPVVAGDVLSMVTTITGIRDAGKNELLVTETAITDQDGKPVATLTATLVSRGTAAQEAAS